MTFGCYNLDFDIHPKMLLWGCLPKSNGETNKEILELYLTLRISPLQNMFRKGFAVIFEEHFINLKLHQMTVETPRQNSNFSAYMT